MTVADDLATYCARCESDQGISTDRGPEWCSVCWDRRQPIGGGLKRYLDRVEAEIAQLVRSRDMYVEQCDEARAEAERLRDGLESADRLLRAVPIDRLAPVTKRIVGEARAAIALVLLAEDGAA